MKIKDELTNILSVILDIFEISDTNDITIADDDFEGVSKPFKYYKGMKL